MANPKYADLPGIAHDEPDFYETTDLPESDQTGADFYEEEGDGVERIHVSAGDAFGKFRGKSLGTAGVDFSDRIGRGLRTGYDARSGDWELAGEGAKETPLQRYQRLQCEFQELLEEVERVKAAGKDESGAGACLLSGEQVEQALKKLADLRLEESLGADLISSIRDPQGAQIKKLMSQLESFKKTAASEKTDSKTSGGDSIVYQFSYRPEQAKLAQTGRLAELESRLHRLETVVGPSDEKLSRLATLTSKRGLLEAAQQLSATASMLDSAQLDHIEGRLTALAQKLDSIAETRQKLSSDEEKDKMILELYELVKNSENISKVLPQTIDRLKALEGLHSRATEFARTLTQMEATHSDIAASIENNKMLLKGVQESFAINLDEINKTAASLDARIKALKK